MAKMGRASELPLLFAPDDDDDDGGNSIAGAALAIGLCLRSFFCCCLGLNLGIAGESSDWLPRKQQQQHSDPRRNSRAQKFLSTDGRALAEGGGGGARAASIITSSSTLYLPSSSVNHAQASIKYCVDVETPAEVIIACVALIACSSHHSPDGTASRHNSSPMVCNES